MSKSVVVYTDLPWAIGSDGRIDAARATAERQILNADDYELRFGPVVDGRYANDSPAMLDAVTSADALVIYRTRITEELLQAAGPRLKVVCRQGVGYDNLSPELLRARGIIGFNIPDYCVDEVATHTMALLLSLERHIVVQHNTLVGGKFDIYAGGSPRRLHTCTAGIIGFGRIGRAISVRLRSFYQRVVAYDPYVSEDLMAAYQVHKVEDLHDFAAQSDAITLHCLLTDETTEMIDEAVLARMKPSSVIVNAARGKLISSKALYQALSEGSIAGAAIDVFHPEDPHLDPWYARALQLPGMVVTSHRAFFSSHSEESQRRRASEGIRQALETGRPPAAGHLTEGFEAFRR
jgi:phosphoglycerate dehydrogenase-like enzyme